MQMDKPLSGKKVALMVASGFNENEMTETQKVLVADGAATTIVSSEIGLVNGWHENAWGHNFFVDVKVGDVLPSQYDAILIPSGERNVRTLSENAHTKRILKGMVDAGKVIGVIGDAVGLLAVAEVISGRTVAAVDEVREAVETAGGTPSGEALVTDDMLVTALGAFAEEEGQQAFIDAFVGRLRGTDADGEAEKAEEAA